MCKKIYQKNENIHDVRMNELINVLLLEMSY